MTKLKFHPVADLFPLMHGAEFDALVDDIREHGLREPITLLEDGRSIDGKNRYRACLKAKREIRTQRYIGPDEGLLDFVVSMMVTIGIRFLCRNFVFSRFPAAC